MCTNISSSTAIRFTSKTIGNKHFLWRTPKIMNSFEQKIDFFLKNRLPNHFFNNDDFVARCKSNRNRQAKCNAIK